MPNFLPDHLKKYIVEQDYERYTAVDHSCWRYILRQLKNFLADNAHESYLSGLDKTGITLERIPRISEISQKLEKFGWRALPVSGFIPPAAFMELQSLGVLPIACDMRTLEHVLYTPAPDIVHEAAGHAPLLANLEYAEYLKKYAVVARKAIISQEDLDVYEAIRELSDIKESPQSTAQDIEKAQDKLNHVTSNVSHISEAAQLSRMNWWTAEYGLIGPLENPKIFGAGLLSSVGESRQCLTDKVKKIPISVDCIHQGYDITEPQPQLYVTSDFKMLGNVLDDFAKTMAYAIGGMSGLDKSILAKSVNTVELNSGIQISGICDSYKTSSNEICFLKFTGSTQLSYENSQLENHGTDYHNKGFSSPIGFVKNVTKCLSHFTENELEKISLKKNERGRLEFQSGVVVSGLVKDFVFKDHKLILVSWTDCTVLFRDEKLFAPDWGDFDMTVGSSVKSVYGGPADRRQYGITDDFVAKKVPTPIYSEDDILRFETFKLIRSLREEKIKSENWIQEADEILKVLMQKFSFEWLMWLEMYEVLLKKAPSHIQTKITLDQLKKISVNYPKFSQLIVEGVAIAHV